MHPAVTLLELFEPARRRRVDRVATLALEEELLACDGIGRDLSRDDAKQIAANVTGFFVVLAEWSRADMHDPANDNGDASTSKDEEVRDDR